MRELAIMPESWLGHIREAYRAARGATPQGSPNPVALAHERRERSARRACPLRGASDLG
jgi:hypothetical protein